jgi:hypothetical protein
MTDSTTHLVEIRYLTTDKSPVTNRRTSLTQWNAVKIAMDTLAHPCMLRGGWSRND